ncbi:hypothetical protein CASFOL_040144 [Castilleja foliolosa]|uniref:B3 domain-containing protein n=1 Tax=Castilleja foliolosa TaxID=1961234 RepID=A0ABD3BGD1_9LAMI
MYTSIQESDGDIDTTLGLAVPEHHHGVMKLINLAGFLILGSKTINANPKPVDDQAPAINLAKILEDTPSDFLGLGIDTSSDYKIDHGRQIVALNPTPLRSFHPKYGFMDFSITQSLQVSSSSSSTGKKRMREQKDNNHVKKERAKRSRVDEYPEPANPPPELVERIGPTGRPIFLYRKQLVGSDILKDQNRLYFNNTEKLMGFLTEEEGEQVKNGKLGFVGIDRMGRVYELSCTRWGRVTIINKDWSKMVASNGARAEHWVDIWGYRCEDGKFRLAFDFHDQL